MSELSHRFIETNGIRMHVAEAGEGPLVVMLHGFPESWYSWRHQLQSLAAAGFHAVAPDLRGYGQTDQPESPGAYTQLHLVGDVVGLLAALGGGPAVVVGHDWGAPVAWNTALFRPDLVRGVAGLSVPYLPRGEVPVLEAMRQMITEHNYQQYFQEVGVAERSLDPDPRRFVLRFMWALAGENPVHTDLSMPPDVDLVDVLADPPALPAWLTPADVDFYAAEFARTGFRGGLNWYRTSHQNWELTAPWQNAPIQVPALFVGGEHDVVVNWPGIRDYIPLMSMFVPKLTQAVILDGCGHWTQQERPDEVNRLLLEFISTLA